MVRTQRASVRPAIRRRRVQIRSRRRRARWPPRRRPWLSAGESAEGVAIDAGAGEYMDEGGSPSRRRRRPEDGHGGDADRRRWAAGPGDRHQDGRGDLHPGYQPPAGRRAFLLDIEPAVEEAANFEVATFAGGCFGGLELAYQREVGVVGTAVGYTQGTAESPTYQEVSRVLRATRKPSKSSSTRRKRATAAVPAARRAAGR